MITAIESQQTAPGSAPHKRLSLPPAVIIATESLSQLALCLWLGGLVVIGAIVAPVAFHLMRSSPDLAGNQALQSALAGRVVGGSLRILNYISYGAGPLIIAADIIDALSSPRRYSPLNVLNPLLLGAAWIIALALGLSLLPALDSAQQHGATQAFDWLHHIYEILSYVQMLLLMGYVILRASVPREMGKHLDGNK